MAESLKVLLVEDSEEDADLIRWHCSGAGFTPRFNVSKAGRPWKRPQRLRLRRGGGGLFHAGLHHARGAGGGAEHRAGYSFLIVSATILEDDAIRAMREARTISS